MNKSKKAPAVDRKAALVVDVDSGKILVSRNGQARRYPASLTKMMTLYLLFDALKQGKLQMDQKLEVSAKAAGQPSTNLSLSPGHEIPVRKVIEGLVVRSANDAAMVVAETLGKTQWNFALMMNRKARELGMKNTVFRNPSGLPDPGQYSTAVDMAKLAIALRRDFPEYYKFFQIREFEYEGRTYTTHNRVMLRYPGADGVKTGYINASGFNVVTSVKRDGYNVVAVVMGGQTGTSRDNEMISMLDNAFVQLASLKKDATLLAKVEEPAASQLAALTPAAGELQGEGDKGDVATEEEPAEEAVQASEEPRGEAKEVKTETASAPVKSPFKKAELPKPVAKSEGGAWGVQVGIYGTRAQAVAAAKKAQAEAGQVLAASQIGVMPMKASKGRTLHRARMTNLDEANAREACKVLANAPGGCLVIQVKQAGA